MESRLDRSEDGCPGIDLLADTCIDNDIRIDRHTDRKDNTGDTRKGEREIECVQQYQHERCIQDKYERSDGTRYKIDDDHNDADDGKTDRTAHDGCADRSLTELSAYDVGPDLIQSELQSADTDIGSELFGLLHRLHTGNLGFAVRDHCIDTRNRYKFPVIVDTDALSVRKSLLGGFLELGSALVTEGKRDHVLAGIRIARADAALCGHDVRAAAYDGSFFLQVFDRLGQSILPGRLIKRVILIPVGICLGDKIERSRSSELCKDLICIGNTRNLDVDPVIAFLVYICFRRILIDTLLELIDRISHILGGWICLIRLICDRYTA